MIDWRKFYADGGYYGLNDPYCYDDGLDEDEEDFTNIEQENEIEDEND